MHITNLQGTTQLNNGVDMPYFGLGVWQSQDGSEVINAIQYAIDYGYRHVDTASIYKNEEGVGKAIKQCGWPRDQIFVTSKCWNSDQGYDTAIRACEDSLRRLQMDYLDLYLIHWPVQGKYKDTWRALEQLLQDGKVRAIGVSNFLRHHLDDLLPTAEVIPAVNQMEFHPHLIQQDLQDFCVSKGIQYEAWAPIMRGEIFEIETLQRLAAKHGKNAAQIVLRWNLQKGVITIPKSVKKERIEANADLFDFELSAADVKMIDALDQGRRIGPDPDNFDF